MLGLWGESRGIAQLGRDWVLRVGMNQLLGIVRGSLRRCGLGRRGLSEQLCRYVCVLLGGSEYRSLGGWHWGRHRGCLGYPLSSKSLKS